MDREQVIWRRPTPEERHQQVSDDLPRTIGFLTAVVAEAKSLFPSFGLFLLVALLTGLPVLVLVPAVARGEA